MAKPSRPNVLILFADQMRGDYLGCSGHPCVKTPNIDTLARDGVRFINAYTPDPICVPARASLMTGNYPFRCTGSKSNRGRIRDDQPKMPEFFARHGYRTYASGKLHFPPYSKPGTPRLLHGFQEAAITEEGRILGQFSPKADAAGLEDYHDYLAEKGWAGYERAHGVGNNDIHPSPSPLPAEHYVDAWVADRAIDYLERHRKAHEDNPFLIFAGFPRPHAPYDPPRPYDAMYDPRDVPPPFRSADEGTRTPTKHAECVTHAWDRFSLQTTQVARAHYLGQVSFQDEQIGRVISNLRSSGDLESTVIVYTADHGDMLGDFGFFAKECFYRGGAGIPFILRCPGLFHSGVVSDELVGLQDIFPTLAALCGLPALGGEDRSESQPDGHDLSGHLINSDPVPREYIVSTCGDDPRQLFMVADNRWKFCYSQVWGVEELYDMENDPAELENVAQSGNHFAELGLMRSRLCEWLIATGDTSVLTDDGFAVNEEPVVSNATFDGSSMGWRWF